jgi:hypothetical protein
MLLGRCAGWCWLAGAGWCWLVQRCEFNLSLINQA